MDISVLKSKFLELGDMIIHAEKFGNNPNDIMEMKNLFDEIAPELYKLFESSH